MDIKDLLKSCRLCLLQGNRLVDIFITRSVLQMLMDCMPFKITETDGFPRKICQVCLDKLVQSHSFMIQALGSHKKLCDLLNVNRSHKDIVKIEPEVAIINEFLSEIETLHYDSEKTKPEDLCGLRNHGESVKKCPKHKATSKIKRKCITSNKQKRKINITPKNELSEIDLGNKADVADDKTDINSVENTETIKNEFHSDGDDLCGQDVELQVSRYCSKKNCDRKEQKDQYEVYTNEDFKCDTCGKSCTGRSMLHSHQRIHYKATCEFCGMVMSKDYLRKHVKARHVKSKKECPICHVVLTGHEYFRTHVKRHTIRRKFPCEICKRLFESRQGRDAHVRAHNNLRPHKCRFCDQTFTILKTRNDHECLHTGARPYGCPLCDRTFIQKSNLKSHFVHNHREHDYKEWTKKVIFNSTAKSKELEIE